VFSVKELSTLRDELQEISHGYSRLELKILLCLVMEDMNTRDTEDQMLKALSTKST